MTKKNFTLAGLFFLVISFQWGAPGIAFGTCSENEHVAVFVLSGVGDGFQTPQIDFVWVSPVEAATNPSNEEIYQNIMATYQDTVNPAFGPGPQDTQGNLGYWSGVSGSSHQTIVDLRDGTVLFAGTVIWMGSGHTIWPLTSSHVWSFVGGGLAGAPSETNTFENNGWGGFEPTTGDMTQMGLELVRSTDLMYSFGECGDYVATGLVYTPEVGAVNPSSARLVLVVEGKVGSPWNDQTVPTESLSWDNLKASYR